MGNLGGDFARAQRAYDNQMPPEGPPEIECPECGGPAHYTDEWRKGHYYMWSAKCDNENCGQLFGDDNFDDGGGKI